jgi:pilus assembly protein Flp/PilA
MMLARITRNPKRRGSILVEYGLLIAGVTLVSVVSLAVLGGKTADQFGIMAGIMPGAHAADNAPVSGGILIAFVPDATGRLVLDNTQLVNTNGTLDRMRGLLGPGGGETLIIDN